MTQQVPELAGLYHLAAAGETSRIEYVRFVLAQAQTQGLALKVAPENVGAATSAKYPTPAKRPQNSRLNTKKLQTAFALHLPDWQSGVARMLTEILEKS